jgi:ATP:ADP antiporter, AAA family
MFLLLFSYPLIRSTTTAVFLDAYGAEKSPHAWLLSILILALGISIYNFFQQKLKINRLYLITVLFSTVCFTVLNFAFSNGQTWAAYFLYVWKEVYIVLLVHMSLGFLNASINLSLAKIIYGPLGAVGSLGGVLGGLLTSSLTKSYSIEAIFYLGLLFVFLSGLLFFFLSGNKGFLSEKNNQRPLQSLTKIKKYVVLIAAIVMLSQFCINLMNFKFNLLFTELFTDPLSKTNFLGKLYSAINGLSLVVQLLVIPIAFKFFKLLTVHRSMPLLYLLGLVFSFFLGTGILPVAGCFLFMKGLDYSLFAAAKELLYFPLEKGQKYGAKYLVDMITYRFSKGLISFFLIFMQAPQVINFLLMTFLLLWFILLIPLFKAYRESE